MAAGRRVPEADQREAEQSFSWVERPPAAEALGEARAAGARQMAEAPIEMAWAAVPLELE